LNGVVVTVDTINARNELALFTSESGGVKGSKIQKSKNCLIKVLGLRAVVVTAKTSVVQVESVRLLFHEVRVASQKE